MQLLPYVGWENAIADLNPGRQEALCALSHYISNHKDTCIQYIRSYRASPHSHHGAVLQPPHSRADPPAQRPGCP
jgi:hypothetical protein